MFAATNPNYIVGGYAATGLALYFFWRLIVWVRDSPARPDPWETDVAQKLDDPETPETCPHCSTPQPPTAWFCEHCGRAVGPYNNLMPYLQVFSEGEVLRNGTNDRMRKSPLIVIGYFLVSFNFLVLAISVVHSSLVLSLVILLSLLSFWIALYRNLYRRDTGLTDRKA